MIDHFSRSTWGPDLDYRQKMFFTPTKTLVCNVFGFIKFSQKHIVEAAGPPQPHFGPLYPWFRARVRSRRSRPDHVEY